ncbi:MAG: rhodanese-like domain-containing protein [Deltaproteobacteria bacterium]|nr:rhodanese-like domain-containing protein [Deltaproteobacteria bacterium]
MKKFLSFILSVFIFCSVTSVLACGEGDHQKSPVGDSSHSSGLLLAQASSDKGQSEASSKKQKKLIIDVRSAQEYEAGHLEGALNIPHTEIGKKIDSITKDKGEEILLYCGSGRRAGLAKEELEKLGYSHVVNGGGYEELKKKH